MRSEMPPHSLHRFRTKQKRFPARLLTEALVKGLAQETHRQVEDTQ